jgi:phosphatidate cytidylyltransferase
MLRDRLITSGLLVGILVLLIVIDARAMPVGSGGLALLPALLAFGLGTGWEYERLVGKAGRPIRKAPFLAGLAVILLAGSMPLWWPIFGSTYPANCPIGRMGWPVIGGFVAVFGLIAWELIRYDRDPGLSTDRVAYGALGLIWIGVPLSYLMVLRQLGDGNWGLAAVLWLIAITKAADAGAYFIGRQWGRHKLAPQISPGKTWEGLAGGGLASTAMAVAAVQWLSPAGTVFDARQAAMGLAIGATGVLAGVVGDLGESLMKRQAGAKDSGATLPGLGGIWDVTDSLLATAVPGCLWFAWLAGR